MKSQASRLVLVMLLAIGFFELGITKRFGQVWNLAFQPTPKAPSQPSGANPSTNYTQAPPLAPDDPNQAAQNQNIT